MKHTQTLGAFPVPFGPHAVQSALEFLRALAGTVMRLGGALTPAAKAEAR